MAELVRLQKYMADCGVASRRKSEELIAAGKVKVNGVIASVGDKVDPKNDTISVNGRKLTKDKNYVYLMLHKPRGYVTTMSDEMDRKCVAELVADVGKRIYPIGRLDRDSEGLLLFTNDGEFANALTHPSRHISKTYRVSVKPAITEDQLTVLTSSLMINGKKTLPAEVRIINREAEKTTLEIILYEGRNRQIRRLCEEAGLETARLKRLSIGQLTLGGLKVGEYRHLTHDEISLLKRQSGCY
ncbi:MAG: rRNA pseudouridine synthase [Clostridia bacterium]|nr:rRNA pseudouridine synthase [Clostridia bacterium]